MKNQSNKEEKKGTEEEIDKLTRDMAEIEAELSHHKNLYLEKLKNGLAEEIKENKGVTIIKTPKWKIIWNKLKDKFLYVLYLLNLYK